MFEFINVLKVIGALLITNSHFDSLYPSAALSIGGSLGNVCFFLASGFCLSSKISVGGGTLKKWIWSRAKRIYPALWVVVTVLALAGKISLSWNNTIAYYFFPYNSYWFIAAIMICYVLMYYVVKYFDNRLWAVGILVFLLYFTIYCSCLDLSKWSVEGPNFFKYIFYFGAMLLGYGLKKICGYISKIDRKKLGLWSGLFVILFLGLYILSKLVLMKFPVLYVIQFIVQVFTLLFGVSLFLFLFSQEQLLGTIANKRLYTVVPNIAASTLEIYLVNYVCVDFCRVIPFPINIFAAFILIGVSGVFLHTVVKKMQKHM